MNNDLGVVLRFYPNQGNPARVSGRGVYRVVSCGNWSPFVGIIVETRLQPVTMLMHADRMYKRGSRVDPLKVALLHRGLKWPGRQE